MKIKSQFCKNLLQSSFFFGFSQRLGCEIRQARGKFGQASTYLGSLATWLVSGFWPN